MLNLDPCPGCGGENFRVRWVVRDEATIDRKGEVLDRVDSDGFDSALSCASCSYIVLTPSLMTPEQRDFFAGVVFFP